MVDVDTLYKIAVATYAHFSMKKPKSLFSSKDRILLEFCMCVVIRDQKWLVDEIRDRAPIKYFHSHVK
jgi:hypothetical protein